MDAYARVRLHVRVPRGLPAQPDKFRRRIPLELTAEELRMLEQEEKRFGTKRATLVAGLQALARALGLEEELEQAVRERDEARAALEAQAAKARKTESALAKTKEEASSAKRGKASLEKKEREQGEQAAFEIDSLNRIVEIEEAKVERLENELEALEAERLLAAYCPRCRKWAKRESWATKAEGEYEFLYHRPCGFHPEDGLRGRSVFGYRAR